MTIQTRISKPAMPVLRNRANMLIRELFSTGPAPGGNSQGSRNSNLHRHIAALNAAFEDAGFHATLSNSPDQYREATARIDGYHIYSPLDDGLVDFGREFLWVGIEDRNQKLVGIEAGRVIDAPMRRGGLNAVLNDRVFGRVLPVISRPPHHNLSGRLAYLGGAWVEPALRGRHIMSLTLKLTVAHLVRCFGIEAVFGFVRSKHAGLSLAEDGYGFTSATTVGQMYLPGESLADTLIMAWTDTGVLDETWLAPAAYSLKQTRETDTPVMK